MRKLRQRLSYLSEASQLVIESELQSLDFSLLLYIWITAVLLLLLRETIGSYDGLENLWL